MTGKGARNKGNGYERKVMNEFVKLGFDDCKTSRNESRTTDSNGIDLVFTDPFNIQCKARESQFNYLKLLETMPKDNNYNLIIHKKNYSGELVVMNKKDFYEIIGMLKTENII